MASNTYFVNGTKYRRSEKQGRKSLPSELVKIPVTIYVIPATKNKIEAKAKGANLSLSAYGEIAMTLFDIQQFSTVENCSTQ